MALPSLQKFSDWAKDSGKPVKVFALNTWERVKTDEEKHAKVKEFWTSKSFTMPTLMDLDGSVATRYQVSSIPRTFVIGPDGAVRQIHVGFAQTMADDLQKEALELLAAKP
jgi:peroxiredoxin